MVLFGLDGVERSLAHRCTQMNTDEKSKIILLILSGGLKNDT